MTEKDKIVGIYEFLDTIAETAARIFNATNVTFRRIEDNVLRVIGATIERVRIWARSDQCETKATTEQTQIDLVTIASHYYFFFKEELF
jgi:hypothetical protein